MPRARTARRHAHRRCLPLAVRSRLAAVVVCTPVVAVAVCALLAAVVVPARPLPAQVAEVAPPAERTPAAGLGLALALGHTTGGGAFSGEGALGGRTVQLARSRWLARPLQLRSEIAWQDLRREAPSACAPACAGFERRRQTVSSGLALEGHHTRRAWHLYPTAGVGLAWTRSTGVRGGLGLTSHLGGGVALPLGLGGTMLTAELRGQRLPVSGRQVWQVPLLASLRF